MKSLQVGVVTKYGLKQAPRAWNKRIDAFLKQIGFLKCTSEHGVYVKCKNKAESLIVCLYVDDLLITCSNSDQIATFKQQMKSGFEMTDLGESAYFLGIEFKRTKLGIVMHQSKYITDVLKRFHMADCNISHTPAEANSVNSQIEEEKPVDKTLFRQMIGTLRYICNTRPDIAYGVGVASRFMENPLQSHLVAVKRVLRYLRGTLGLGLGIMFPSKQNINCKLDLLGFSDAYWCGDKSDRKSTTGYLFKLGEAPISWCYKKQDVVALSSCESEYMLLLCVNDKQLG
ncbi:PREDICTED: uncharacterized protein LOC109341296 [Lupinus angustifolius]|uniref:uncharacterized protein LOC109341296 n=1 Tax=Lupinus angustifolius TaxID=3871 RepID=UPI00092E5E12|nr:PREDICTED: uncharacterized protein LOC109341296 [Lupinus angustifolius]